MSDDVLVKVDNVSKRFCRSLKRSLWYGLQDLGSEIGGRRHGGGSGLPQSSADVQLRLDEFWAVKDVSFELRRGECLGLIGRNGAGKTTLLRMLNGLIKPDTGKIEITGRVGAIIALGAGFNPILSGRENILINLSVLGISKLEAKARMDEIIDFAELGDFIDAPVQSYSSGMQVRLGFAVATLLQPDVLILDEVLSVGDARFRAKCNKKMSEIIGNSATIIVSHHQAELSRICHSGIYLECGKAGSKNDLKTLYQDYKKREDTRDIERSLASRIDKASLITSYSRLEFSMFIDAPRPTTSTSCVGLSISFNLDSEVNIKSAFVNILDEFEDIHATLPLSDLKYIPSGMVSIKVSTGRLMLSPSRYFLHLYIDTSDKGLLVSALRAAELIVDDGPLDAYSSHIVSTKSIDIVQMPQA
jgi:lipopolysaccharide transport system ATP-binding protein